MANDIIAGPEILEIKGTVFWLCPLSEYGFACLSAWIRYISEGKLSGDMYEDEEACSLLITPVGSAQLLYWSTRKNNTQTLNDLIDFIDGDSEVAWQIFEFFRKLNTDPKAKQIESTGAGTVPNVDEAYLYTTIAKIFGMTISEVADLTKVQQKELLNKITQNTAPNGNLQFDTEEDYVKWKLNNEQRK